MTEVLLFWIGVHALILTWAKLWQWTYIDDSRDRLFDVREELRLYFLDRDLGLDHDIYLTLRGMINRHIRFLEEVTLTQLLSLLSVQRRRPELFKAAENKIQMSLRTDDKELEQFVLATRVRIGQILVLHISKTSLALAILSVVGTVILVIRSLFKHSLARVRGVRRGFFIASKDTAQRIFGGGKFLEEVSLYSAR